MSKLYRGATAEASRDLCAMMAMATMLPPPPTDWLTLYWRISYAIADSGDIFRLVWFCHLVTTSTSASLSVYRIRNTHVALDLCIAHACVYIGQHRNGFQWPRDVHEIHAIAEAIVRYVPRVRYPHMICIVYAMRVTVKWINLIMYLHLYTHQELC